MPLNIVDCLFPVFVFDSAGRFHTVEGFWALYSHMIRPDNVEGSVDLMLFRDGIQVRASRYHP